VLLVLGLSEVFEHLLGGSKKDQLPSAIEQDRLVKHLENL